MLCILVTACSKDGAEIAEQKWADHIFSNGEIYTVEDENPWADAVVVKGDEIVFVGTEDGADAYSGPETLRHDLGGRIMMPGFIDSHTHMLLGGGYVNALSLDSAANPEDWLKSLSEYVTENPDLPVVFGFGFDSAGFGTSAPTKEMIDAVVSDRPVFLMDEGFHSGWSNSKTMEVLGITKDTPDPTPGFDYYKRDQNGNPTGWYMEAAATAALESLNVFSVDYVLNGTRQVFDIMNGYGITSGYDAGYFEVAAQAPEVLRKLDEADQYTVRFVGSLLITKPEQALDAVEKLQELSRTTKTDNYHIRVLKILNDGTIEARSAGMFEDYQGEPGNSGAVMLEQEQLTKLVTDTAAAGFDVHIHALGERTVDEALNAIEYAQNTHPTSETRYTICHVQVMTHEAVKRFADLNIIAQGTPLWSSYDELGKRFVSEDQFNRYFLFNSLKEAGVRLTFGSDYPSTGAGELGISPIYNIEIGHTRQEAGERDAPIQPPTSERLDVEALIRGYTYDAAYQLHMEEEIGSIKAGKKADLVILNQNPFKVDDYKIHTIEVDMTMKGGRVVYER